MNKFIKIAAISTIVALLNLEAKVDVVISVSKPVGTVDKDFDDSEIQFGIAVQPYLTDNLALDIRLDSSNANKMADGGKSDLERMSLNLLYDFMPKSSISPYIFAGSGYEKIHRTYLDIKSQPFLNGGIGLKVDINDDIDIRSEAKYIRMSHTKDSDVVASLGFGVKFGYESCIEVCEEDVLTTKPIITKNTTKIKVKPAVKSAVKSIKANAVLFDDEKKPTYKIKIIKKQTKQSKSKNYIQVAALSNKTNVAKIIKKLKLKKLKVRTIKKGSVTVVLAGPYSGGALVGAYNRVKTIQKDAFYKKL
ncbi:MAG TPA: porin family protein [Campylobacterales bacterium]|nr:porin family protein [Campylobacterales bacterium]